MPYLKHDDRERLLDHMYPVNGGELNFCLTVILNRFWAKSARRYEDLNTISGAATESLAEFRRRVIVPYEQGAIERNGDLY